MKIKDILKEMANMSSLKTGLPTSIWIGTVGGQHGPRIKVCNSPGKMDINNTFVVSVSSNSQVLTPATLKMKTKDLEKVLTWVNINSKTLLEIYYNFEAGNDPSYLFKELKTLT